MEEAGLSVRETRLARTGVCAVDAEILSLPIPQKNEEVIFEKSDGAGAKVTRGMRKAPPKRKEG